MTAGAPNRTSGGDKGIRKALRQQAKAGQPQRPPAQRVGRCQRRWLCFAAKGVRIRAALDPEPCAAKGI